MVEGLNNNQANNQNQEAAKFPEPGKKEKVKIHTLESDLEKIKRGEGEINLSDTFEEKGSQESKEPLFSPPPFEEKDREVPLPSEEGGFSRDEAEEFLESQEKVSQKEKTGFKKKWLIILIGLIFIILVAFLLIYFLVLKRAEKTEEIMPTPFVTPVPTITPVPTNPPTPQLTPLTFKSLLAVEVEKKTLEIPILNREVIYHLLSQETEGEKGTLREFFLSLEKRPVKFSDFFLTVIPEIYSVASRENIDLKTIFEDDFSLVITYPEDYPQLAYIAQIKEGKREEAGKLIEDLINEKDLVYSLRQFHFFADPGKASDRGFRRGKLGDIETYFLTFSNPDLAFDFGLSVDNKLIVFTSMKSLKIILKYLPSLSQVPIE
ncbi:hypothetical protein J7J37_01110 [bacterium]|nr:hypothetical protein [bacterium]